jgi:uncharacterized protein (UPF0335 family)
MDLRQFIVSRIETVESIIETLQETVPDCVTTIREYQIESWALASLLRRFDADQDETVDFEAKNA